MVLGMFTRESTIRRDARGRWFHDGEPIDQPAIERAFDRWIDVAEDGRYILKNSVNWVYVEIEGAPIFVNAVQLEPERAILILSDDSEEDLAIDTLRQDEAGVLYCDVRAGKLTAMFTRKAQLMLEPAVGQDAHGVYLEIGGVKVRPPVVPAR
jgi:hypothetical protein